MLPLEVALPLPAGFGETTRLTLLSAEALTRTGSLKDNASFQLSAAWSKLSLNDCRAASGLLKLLKSSNVALDW